MALTPEQISGLVSAVNQLYGAGTLPQNATEEQLRALAADKLRGLETKLNALDDFAKTNAAFIKSQGHVAVDGVWDEETATRLFVLENILANPQLAQTIEAQAKAAGDTIRNGGHYTGITADISAAENRVRDAGKQIQAFNPNELLLIRQLNDALAGTNTPERLVTASLAEQETAFKEAVAGANAAVPAARDWLNAHRDAINALLPAELTAEERNALTIPAIPPGDVSLSTPAFAHAYSRALSIYSLLQQSGRANEFPAGSETVMTPLAPAIDVIQAYDGLYAELGDTATLPQDPVDLMKSYALYDFKLTLAQLDKIGVFGDLPDFDPKQKPFDANDPAFLAAWKKAAQNMVENGLTPDKLNETANNAIQAILGDQNVPGEFKEKLNAAPDLQTKIDLILSGNEAPQSAAIQIVSATRLNAMLANLPPEIQTVLGQAVSGETVAPAPAPGDGQQQTPPPQQQEPPKQDPPAPAPLKLSDFFTKDMRYATYAVELALFNHVDQDTVINPPNKPDQYLDHNTRHQVEKTIMENFSRYGMEYYTGVKLISGTGAFYTFDQNGNIYEVAKNPDGTAKRDENGKPVLASDSAVGHITDGIHVTDDDGYARKPHEATVLFMEALRDQLTGPEVAPLSQGPDAQDETAHHRIERQLNDKISAFFAGNNELETEYRATLRRLQGMDADAFLKSDLARRMREAKQGSGEDVDAFIMFTFQLEADRIGTGLGMADFETNAGDVSSIANLLRIMAGGQYDPRKAMEIRGQLPFQRDNILSLNAYEILRHMKGGENIAVEALYEDDNEPQKQAILKEFEGRTSVSREEVYAFVRKQFDLRAIETLTGDSAANLSPSEQNAFIAEHADVLDGVSQAMYEGRFDPYEEDVHLVFKAFQRPGFSDPKIRERIDMEHAGGNTPPAVYAINNLSVEDLKILTGDPNFDQRGPQDQQAALKALLDLDTNTALSQLNPQGREIYERLVMNYYEPTMANFTWWRNGEVNDNTMDTWNGRYGEPNQDQLMHMFMRYKWNSLDDIFGENAEHMRSILFNTSRTKLNFDLTYDEVVSQLNASERAALDKGIEDLHRPSMYMYLMRLRIDHYRDMRNRHYIPSLQDAQLAQSFADAAPDANPNAGPEKPGDGQDPGDTGPAEHKTYETPYKYEDVWPDAASLVKGQTAKVVAGRLAPGTKAPANPEKLPAVVDEFAPAARGKMPGQVRKAISLLEMAQNPGATPAERETAGKMARRWMEKHNLSEADVARWVEAEKAAPVTGLGAVDDAVDAAARTATSASNAAAQVFGDGKTHYRLASWAMGAKDIPQSFMEEMFRVGSDGKTLYETLKATSQDSAKAAFDAAKTAGTADSLYKIPAWAADWQAKGIPHTVIERYFRIPANGGKTAYEVLENTIPRSKSLIIRAGTELDIVRKTMANPKLARASGFMRVAGDVLSGAGKLGKLFVRALPVVGAGIATWEVATLSGQHEALQAAGLLPEEAWLELDAEYAAHIAQSGFDPTLFGGEAVTWGAITAIAAQYDLDPATLQMICPGFASRMVKNLFDGDELSQEDYINLKATYSPEAIKDMMDRVLDHYGMEERTIQLEDGSVYSISDAMRNETLAALVRAQYPQYKDALDAVEVVNNTIAYALETIEKHEKTEAFLSTRTEITGQPNPGALTLAAAPAAPVQTM